jgi:2,4-dienoyl-CoA reductase-like NADH-dependent reductase (Old Yellow Enzyme family)
VTDYRRIASLRDLGALRAHLRAIGAEIPLEDGPVEPQGPLARPYRLADGFSVGNRFCIHPMEGWDATPEGRPGELTRRRWRRFGQSGAKLVWGCEAVAVSPEGRANPNQLLMTAECAEDLAGLRRELVADHERAFGTSADLLVGLQLTHSGRFARPFAKAEARPAILYRHPVLDRRLGIVDDGPVLTDDDVTRLVASFVDAAVAASHAGFDFVDVKHCHGYLGHEFLSAHTRTGAYGGSFENRTRFLREVVAGIRSRVPELRIGVRVSAFDVLPYRPGATGLGEAEAAPRPYRWGFGLDPHAPERPLLDECFALFDLFSALGIELVNVTAGSPYYNPHVQRPALFPPSDGYAPPEDPLVGVARQIAATAVLKQRFPRLALVGSAYSYLQEWLPLVAQSVVRGGGADFVGLGRMALSYPDLPADVFAGRALDRKRLCRTFSDCTSAPRKGLVSGCYPLDDLYKDRPEAAVLKQLKTDPDRP